MTRPMKMRRQMLRTSNSRPGKQFEIALCGSVLGGLPAARWKSCAALFFGVSSLIGGISSLRGASAAAVGAIGGEADLVALPSRENEVTRVGVAHHAGHLAAPEVGEIADLVELAQHRDEP